MSTFSNLKLALGHPITGFAALVLASNLFQDQVLTVALSVMLVPILGAAIDGIKQKAGVEEEKEPMVLNDDPVPPNN